MGVGVLYSNVSNKYSVSTNTSLVADVKSLIVCDDFKIVYVLVVPVLLHIYCMLICILGFCCFFFFFVDTNINTYMC